MWDMRRNLDLTPMPDRRCTIQFHYPELPTSRQYYWLVIDNGLVDVCQVNPGYEVDLFVECSLRTMTAIWMGLTSVRTEMDAGRMELHLVRADVRRLIEEAGRVPVERDTLYNELRRWEP